ncbi:MAG: hypothetical protein ABF289_17040 [Clostridiales bacterium]
MYGVKVLPTTGAVGIYATSANLYFGFGVFLIITGIILFKHFRLRVNEKK